MKFNNIILGSLALATLFSGCSSYKLQDYADDYFNQKPSSASQSSSKSIQTSSSSNEYDDVWREFDEISPQKSVAPEEKESVMEASHEEAIGETAANYDNTHNALQTISPTPTYVKGEREGLLQESYDDFVKKEWSPNVEESKEISEKYGDKERSFTLQEYVDKWNVYNEKHQSPEWESNVKKIDNMPVIGK